MYITSLVLAQYASCFLLVNTFGTLSSDWFNIIAAQGPEKNASYATNLAAVEKLVLVQVRCVHDKHEDDNDDIQFTRDSIVDPRQSEWFGWFSEEDHKTMLPLQVGSIMTWLVT